MLGIFGLGNLVADCGGMRSMGWVKVQSIRLRETAVNEDIQAEPPSHYRKADLDDFPDFILRKPRRLLRLWVIGTTCYLCGLIAHVVLNEFAPITGGRAQMAGNAFFEAMWYGVGLLLLFVDACMEDNPGPRKAKFLGCLLGSVVAFVLFVISFPP